MLQIKSITIVILLSILLSACGDTADNMGSKIDRILNIISGNDKHKTGYLLAQQVVNLQKLIMINNEIKMHLSGIWRGEIDSVEKLKATNDKARSLLASLSKGINDQSINQKLEAYNKVLPTLQPTWNKMLDTSALSINNSTQLNHLRGLLQALQRNAHQYTTSLNDYIPQIVGLRSNKENTMMLYYLSYILSKSMDIEQRIQYLLTTNILDDKPLKHIMRAQTNIQRILRGMFRGDKRTNIKILIDKTRRKVVQDLTTQFETLNFLQLEDAYEKLRENHYSMDNQQIDFNETAKVTDYAIHTLTAVMNN